MTPALLSGDTGGCQMSTQRGGFTLIEVALVVVIAGLVMGLAAPKMSAISAASNMTAAQHRLVSSLATARAAAIRRGREARVIITTDTLTVSVEQGGSQVALIPPVSLHDRFGVE